MSTSWNRKVIVVAGASRGLGFEIAKQFASQGARVVLLARDQDRLVTALQELSQSVDAADQANTFFTVDLCNFNDVENVTQEILKQFGRIDAWVNAVGQSIRTDFGKTTAATYRMLMEQNFFAGLNGSLVALKHLDRTNGSLVNIGSLASRTAWPFVGPYVTSKHAMDGFARQLRIEGPPNIHYLLVCTGPIKSNDGQLKYRDQVEKLPEKAKRPGAGAPVKGIDPEWLAKKIVHFCDKRRLELIVPVQTKLLFAISELAPTFGDWLIRRLSK